MLHFFEKWLYTFTDKYNAYLQINGGTIGEASCDRAAKDTDASYINKDTPLIYLVSHDNEGIPKYDWLYIVIMDIVSDIILCCSFKDITVLFKDWL